VKQLEYLTTPQDGVVADRPGPLADVLTHTPPDTTAGRLTSCCGNAGQHGKHF